MSMKNSSDTIGNRTRDLPAYSAVPQPNASPRAPRKQCTSSIPYTVFMCVLIGNVTYLLLAHYDRRPKVESLHSKRYIIFTVVWDNT